VLFSNSDAPLSLRKNSEFTTVFVFNINRESRTLRILIQTLKIRARGGEGGGRRRTGTRRELLAELGDQNLCSFFVGKRLTNAEKLISEP